MATAFAIPYALVQPILGALADMFGKARLLLICLSIVVIAAVISTVATSFPMLLAVRVLFGIGSGGIFPIGLALVGDLVPVAGRQVAIARLLGASMTAIVLGAAGAGIVGDVFGWRMVFFLNAALGMAALAGAIYGFRNANLPPPDMKGVASLISGYRALFRNPLSKVCFTAVLIEGLLVQGMFPYVAILLRDQGEYRAAIAGLVLAGWGIGGFVYTLIVSRLLPHFTERVLMVTGGTFTALVYGVLALGPSWQVFFAVYTVLGLSFYLLHSFIQVYATELAPEARGSALAMHSSCFFLGQACGPIVYGFGFSHLGTPATLVLAGVIMLSTAVWCANSLRRPEMSPL